MVQLLLCLFAHLHEGLLSKVGEPMKAMSASREEVRDQCQGSPIISPLSLMQTLLHTFLSLFLFPRGNCAHPFTLGVDSNNKPSLTQIPSIMRIPRHPTLLTSSGINPLDPPLLHLASTQPETPSIISSSSSVGTARRR